MKTFLFFVQIQCNTFLSLRNYTTMSTCFALILTESYQSFLLFCLLTIQFSMNPSNFKIMIEILLLQKFLFNGLTFTSYAFERKMRKKNNYARLDWYDMSVCLSIHLSLLFICLLIYSFLLFTYLCSILF